MASLKILTNSTEYILTFEWSLKFHGGRHSTVTTPSMFLSSNTQLRNSFAPCSSLDSYKLSINSYILTRNIPFNSKSANSQKVMFNSDKDDLYADNYYEYGGPERRSSLLGNHTARNELEITISASTMFRGILTIFLRIGFLLIQIGSVPVNNVNLILLQNIADFCVVTIAYSLIGFIIAFNGDVGGIIGEGVWIGQSQANKEEAILGWQAVVTASALCTCGTSGRMHAVGYLLIGALLAGVVQPFLLHWAWTPNGWMTDHTFSSKRVAFRDHAGAGIVHTVGALSGLIGCIVLGRRILLLRDIDDASLPVSSPGTAFAGHLLVLLGLQGLALPDQRSSYNRHVPHILLNNLLAAASCGLFVIALHFVLSREAFNHWTVMRCIQATVAGVVTVSAGADAYSPAMTIAISCAGAVVFYLTSRRVFRSALEDYCNIVATHLTSALLGSFLSPFCITMRPDADYLGMVLDLTWQVISLVALISFVTVVMSVAFILLEVFGILRNRSEIVNHLRSVAALERGPPRSFMQRLFFPDGETLYLQPGAPAKGERGTDATSSRLSSYEQEIARLKRTRPAELDPRPQEIVDEAAVPNSSQSPTIKKFRQAHTIRTMMTGPVRLEDTGGGGETMMEGDCRLDDLKMTVDSFRGLEDTDENTLRTDEGYLFEEFDHGEPSWKEPQYRLHRTHKLMSLLHLEELEKETNKCELNVKVLVEPKRSFSSSDSNRESPRENLGESLDEFQGKSTVVEDTCECVSPS